MGGPVCKARNVVIVAFIDDDPKNLESILEEVGNDERVFCEEYA